jgi:uncharacterized metal-binding protein (TIGR02443 family)
MLTNQTIKKTKLPHDSRDADRYTSVLYKSEPFMKKRFIAGVVCPKCGAMDAMRAGETEDGAVLERECIECGFVDRLSTGLNTPNEVSTRVTDKAPSSADNEPVQIVKIIE